MHVKSTFCINSQDLLQKSVEVFEELEAGNNLTLNNFYLRDTTRRITKLYRIL